MISNLVACAIYIVLIIDAVVLVDIKQELKRLADEMKHKGGAE